MSDYGAGRSGEVIVHRSGPMPPPPDAVLEAKALLAGVEPPCMDCVPNLVLKDYVDEAGQWQWGFLVAHDDTCPLILGVLGG